MHNKPDPYHELECGKVVVRTMDINWWFWNASFI